MPWETVDGPNCTFTCLQVLALANKPTPDLAQALWEMTSQQNIARYHAALGLGMA